MNKDYGIFHVAFKILLKNDGKFLFLKDSTKFNRWDLPGGRADNIEFEVPIEKIIKREIKEELGNIKYEIGSPLLQYRRFYEPKNIYILVTVYDAIFRSGKIKLSDEHNSYHWVDPKIHGFTKDKFWAREEYETWIKYFKNMN